MPQTSSSTCVTSLNRTLTAIKDNEHLNAYLDVYAEEAQQQAQAVDQRMAAGTAGPLAGMIVGLKDMLCYQDHPCTAASKILQGFKPTFSATAVERLLKADVIINGRHNCDEFGMGSSNENSAFGPVRNPIDTTKVPGGSSGGSAAAVRAGLCDVALGTDTGGSVRQPASFCGVIGLKPTYGRISRHGLVAFASSFDTIGILSRDIPACARTLSVIAGPDEYDMTAAHQPVPDYNQQLTWPKKAHIAYPVEGLNHPRLQPAIKKQTERTLASLEAQGHTVSGIAFPLLKYALPVYYILTTAEASSNLARFDGIQYGYRDTNAQTLEELYTQTRTTGFGAEVKRRIILGNFLLSEGYAQESYVKAQQVRRIIRSYMLEQLATYDLILMPTTPTTAFPLNSFAEKDPMQMYLEDFFTVPASVAGLPGLSIPNGVDEAGLPIGLQLIGAPFAEDRLLAFAKHLYDTQAAVPFQSNQNL